MFTFQTSAQAPLSDKPGAQSEIKSDATSNGIPRRLEVGPKSDSESDPVSPLPVILQNFQPIVDSNGEALAMPSDGDIYALQAVAGPRRIFSFGG